MIALHSGLAMRTESTMTGIIRCLCLCSVTLLAVGGCESASYGQRGTVLGALGGGGIGALIGHATHHTAAGALIGTGVGAVAGGATGTALDNLDAKKRAEAEANLNRDPGGATTTEVLAMTRAGVDPQLIVNYVNSDGVAQPLTYQDIIYLRDQGVDYRVVLAMQNCQLPGVPPGYVRAVPPRQTVIIDDDPWGGPCCYPHYGISYGLGCHCR
jgi:outer membrane lipoprotein SlyB